MNQLDKNILETLQRQADISNKELAAQNGLAESSMLNSLDQSLVDIQRLLMLVLKKMGAKDVVGELDELCEEIQKQAKELTKKRKA